MCGLKPSPMMEKRKEEARRRYNENAPGYPESMLTDLPTLVSTTSIELEFKIDSKENK